ncbi:MAG: GNAT family N-acetyltransferase [Candidatus Micrarchaeota archaeon]|nr:GNAT family N-acetyltransferase [Candidatus Micrarchaeota archaeon]
MRISASGFRVHLETLSIGDAKGIVESANDAEVAASTPGMPYPYSMEQAMQFIGFARQTYIAREEFHMGIQMGNGGVVGLCALANIDRQNLRAELGYFVGTAHRGKGYGKEALRLMLGFGFGTLGLNRIYAKVLTDNLRSASLLDSLGFRNEGRNREDVLSLGRFLDDYTFGILRKEYSDSAPVVVTDY